MPTTQHPDEVVAQVADVEEVPSELVAQAKLRHDFAKTEFANPQEKKQAAIEEAHALSTRPDGSYAQLHETEDPTLAVADGSRVEELKKEQGEALDKLQGSAPVNSPAGVKAEEAAAKQRNTAAAPGTASDKAEKAPAATRK